MLPLPKLTRITRKYFRLIPSVFPTQNFFEDLVDPAEMETLWEIESLTNERIRHEAGDIFLVPSEDVVSGQGASIIMAAFTHIGKPSRFSDGSFGVYYAGLSPETAIKETIYHRELFLGATHEEACEITMRFYTGKIVKPLHDLRGSQFSQLHHSDNYTHSQIFGKKLRASQSWGVVYHSVRHLGGQCVAVFRPPALSIPIPLTHLRYVWNGNKIVEVLDTQSIFSFC